MSDKVVLIVRQILAIRVIGTTLSGKLDHLRLKQGGPNSLNKRSQLSDGSNSLTYSNCCIMLSCFSFCLEKKEEYAISFCAILFAKLIKHCS